MARDSGVRFALPVPETLRAELHGVRAVVEAHSHGQRVRGSGDANGIAFSNGSNTPLNLRITDSAGLSHYKLDRWD